MDKLQFKTKGEVIVDEGAQGSLSGKSLLAGIMK